MTAVRAIDERDAAPGEVGRHIRHRAAGHRRDEQQAEGDAGRQPERRVQRQGQQRRADDLDQRGHDERARLAEDADEVFDAQRRAHAEHRQRQLHGGEPPLVADVELEHARRADASGAGAGVAHHLDQHGARLVGVCAWRGKLMRNGAVPRRSRRGRGSPCDRSRSWWRARRRRRRTPGSRAPARRRGRRSCARGCRRRASASGSGAAAR